MEDLGIRNLDFVSSFLSSIYSSNRGLERVRAIALGTEFKNKSNNVLLGPVVGPLGRISKGGRNWEGFSNDPYLCGALAFEAVSGAQSSRVITSTKTMHELYLWPFVDAVKAGTGCIMCSYQRINNTYGCHNAKTQNGILATELGFQGFIVSDWNAQHAGVASALGGLDMVMPSANAFWGPNLTQAVRNASVPEARLNDMVTRILAAWYKYGHNELPPGFGMPAVLTTPHEPVDVRDPAMRGNDGGLPLSSPKLLSLYGYDALPPRPYNPSPPGPQTNNSWVVGGSPLDPTTPAINRSIASEGTLMTGGGSGSATPSYISSPYEAISAYAQRKGIALFWDFDNVNNTGAVVGATNACLVFINAWAQEGNDRPDIANAQDDQLVNNIADQCNNTIVVIHNAGIRLVDGFYDHPNVTAILYAHLPGQDSGNALVEILFGNQSPSGKLPYTVARQAQDYIPLLDPVPPITPYTYFPQDDFSEGGLIDYRAFDALNITPRFEFGFGLTYTTFEYSNISIQDIAFTNAAQYPSAPILQGGRTDLFDVLARVEVDITNTGNVQAAEIAQLYITIPNSRINVPTQRAPVGRQLRGFEKRVVAPGETVRFGFPLTRRDLSQWDMVVQEWGLEQGTYTVEAGGSSRDLPLRGELRR
ncbi:glycoside hydrolase family 3 protein [Elsinoe ampelina]|uniref:beta-glucosidase n=1 Tax=Elsinoe ampelina TaxID=302913 RepID=A0A6A6GE43_9PEZI|nr:glycoside hydrolase family 3 protein [Elsinoe ampelina]